MKKLPTTTQTNKEPQLSSGELGPLISAHGFGEGFATIKAQVKEQVADQLKPMKQAVLTTGMNTQVLIFSTPV